MGNQQSSNHRGGANLPPELIAYIGRYSDLDTRTRLRRTGKDAFMVPQTTINPSSEDMVMNSRFPLEAAAHLVMEDDSPRHRRIFLDLLHTEDDDHIIV